uniref:Uncharacterized protein n=1 Tax=Mycolicibacterium neoaurum VKM Ac-1815D TaxID=700508 RepID=V5XIX2_MYCNE
MRRRDGRTRVAEGTEVYRLGEDGIPVFSSSDVID